MLYSKLDQLRNERKRMKSVAIAATRVCFCCERSNSFPGLLSVVLLKLACSYLAKAVEQSSPDMSTKIMSIGCWHWN